MGSCSRTRASHAPSSRSRPSPRAASSSCSGSSPSCASPTLVRLLVHLAALILGVLACSQPALGATEIVDNIDWQVYLDRHDPIWRWDEQCTRGYTVYPSTIRYNDGASGCPSLTCSSAGTCVEEAAALCDSCATCASFGLSPAWHAGLVPQVFAHEDAGGMVQHLQWTTYAKGGPALSNHSSCTISPAPASPSSSPSSPFPAPSSTPSSSGQQLPWKLNSGAATAWEDAVFYGNGLLGGLVLVDGADPLRTLRFQLGRTDVADHRDAGSAFATGNLMFDKPRLPIGSLGLTTAGNITGGEMRIHLQNGTVSGQLNTTAGEISFVLLAHYTQLAIVLQWNATGGEAPDPATGAGGANLSFVPLPGNSTRHTPPQSYHDNPPPVCTGEAWHGEVQTCTQSLLVGGNYATAWATRAWGPASSTATSRSPTGDIQVHLLTVLHIANDFPASTSPESALKVVEQLHDAAAADQGQGLFQVLLEHALWWQGFWPASFLSIPDTAMEAMYVMQQYKYASAARGGGPAIDLMGPWWQPSGWELYWWDMNVPVTYWATYAARRFDIAGTLSWWLEEHLSTLPDNVHVPPGRPNITDGMGFGSITSFDMVAPMLIAPDQQLGNPTWIAHNLYLHASYTANITMMRDLVFPFLRGTVNTYLAFSFNGTDGHIHLPPTASPEYPYRHGPANDTHYDLALFKWGAGTLLKLAAELGISDPLILRWQDVVRRLVPFPTNSNGYMVDSVNGFDVGHRHFSHLFAIYPLHLTTWDPADGGTPESQALMAQSINRWTGLTCTGGPQKNLCPNGFTFDGAASMSALVPGREAASTGNITGFIESGEMHASTLYSEGHQPCFESPPGAANALQEILLQSWGGRIRVFPSVPAAWPDVVIHKLGAEGGFAVSAVRTRGKLAWVGIEAVDYTHGTEHGTDADQVRQVVLVTNGLGPAASVSTDPPNVPLTDTAGGGISFNVTIGQLVVLFPTDARPSAFSVTQLPGNASQYHYWGKRS